MYLTLLVVVDSNTKSWLVAQCLSENETVDSHEWFLECILKLTNGISPVQNLLDNEAKWAWHNKYLQSLPTNQAPSINEPIFSKVIELMTKYLIPHILSVQRQQIVGSLLYRAKNIPKETINNIK
ncbi:19182_t:CDS:2, partial [Gigaspora rosea]